MSIRTWWGGSDQERDRLFSLRGSQNKRQWAQMEIHGIPLKHMKIFIFILQRWASTETHCPERLLQSLCLEIFKIWLDMALSNLLLHSASVCWSRWFPEVFSNLSCCMIHWYVETLSLFSKALTSLKESQTVCSNFHGLKQSVVVFIYLFIFSRVWEGMKFIKNLLTKGHTICFILLSFIPSLKGNKAVFPVLKCDVLFESYSRATAGKEGLGFTESQTLYITAVNPERLLIQLAIHIFNWGKNIQAVTTLKLIVSDTHRSLTEFHFNSRLTSFIKSKDENKICHKST